MQRAMLRVDFQKAQAVLLALTENERERMREGHLWQNNMQIFGAYFSAAA